MKDSMTSPRSSRIYDTSHNFYSRDRENGSELEIGEEEDLPVGLSNTQGLSHHGLAKLLSKLNPLYDVCNRLSSQGLKFDFKLPRIIVCGSQSTGRTSVLESICQEELLPKGDTIQTRCPIMLQLVRHESEKWVEFPELGSEGKKYTNMEEVRQFIQQHNDGIKNSGEIISDKVFTVKLFSPHVMDLTLIDLPGLIVNNVDESLVTRIEGVVRDYISDPDSIILVVAAATYNIENERSVAEARKVDPERMRTIVVITKLDRATETNAYDTLRGWILPKYELGIFGVVNRSKDDRHKSYDEIRAKEQQVLKTDFPNVAAQNGIPRLVDHVCGILFQKVTEALPSIKGTIETRIKEYSDRLEQLGGEDEPNERHERFLTYLISFIQTYCGQIDGKQRNMNISNCSASATINFVYEKMFTLELGGDELVWTDDDIDKAILHSQPLHGVSSFFDVTDACQQYAKRKILTLKPLVTGWAKDVQTVMIDAIHTSIDHEARRYPNLTNNIAKVVSDVIGTCHDACFKYLEDYIDAESAICRFSPTSLEFVENGVDARGSSSEAGGAAADRSWNPPQQPTAATGKNLPLPAAKDHRWNVRDSVDQYVKEANVSIKSHVPRAIAYKLVYGVVDQLNKVLITELHKEQKIDHLMRESEPLRRDREHTVTMLKGYKDCLESVDETLENPDRY